MFYIVSMVPVRNDDTVWKSFIFTLNSAIAVMLSQFLALSTSCVIISILVCWQYLRASGAAAWQADPLTQSRPGLNSELLLRFTTARDWPELSAKRRNHNSPVSRNTPPSYGQKDKYPSEVFVLFLKSYMLASISEEDLNALGLIAYSKSKLWIQKRKPQRCLMPSLEKQQIPGVMYGLLNIHPNSKESWEQNKEAMCPSIYFWPYLPCQHLNSLLHSCWSCFYCTNLYRFPGDLVKYHFFIWSEEKPT